MSQDDAGPPTSQENYARSTRTYGASGLLAFDGTWKHEKKCELFLVMRGAV